MKDIPHIGSKVDATGTGAFSRDLQALAEPAGSLFLGVLHDLLFGGQKAPPNLILV